MEVKRLPVMVSLTFLLIASRVLRALEGKVGAPLSCTFDHHISMMSLRFFSFSMLEEGNELRE